eukprot:gene18794-883_t
MTQPSPPFSRHYATPTNGFLREPLSTVVVNHNSGVEGVVLVDFEEDEAGIEAEEEPLEEPLLLLRICSRPRCANTFFKTVAIAVMFAILLTMMLRCVSSLLAAAEEHLEVVLEDGDEAEELRGLGDTSSLSADFMQEVDATM